MQARGGVRSVDAGRREWIQYQRHYIAKQGDPDFEPAAGQRPIARGGE
jgi:hypothetical protein